MVSRIISEVSPVRTNLRTTIIQQLASLMKTSEVKWLNCQPVPTGHGSVKPEGTKLEPVNGNTKL